MKEKELDTVLGTRISKAFLRDLKAAARLDDRPTASYVRHVLRRAVQADLGRGRNREAA